MGDIGIIVTIRVKVSEQRLQDLLTSAFEGGSNYWYMIEEHIYPEGRDKELSGYHPAELPFKGGGVKISSGGDMPVKVLDKAAIEKGLALMAEQRPEDMANFLDENDDANTGDVFLQLCLYGEIIFG